MAIDYKYSLGFKVNGTAIPDPQGFGYTVADLDTSAARNANGMLYRTRVATKHNVSLSYKVIEYSKATEILGLITGAHFQFTFPRPDTGTLYTGKYYVGDRKCDAIWLPEGHPEKWIADLSFNIIEY